MQVLMDANFKIILQINPSLHIEALLFYFFTIYDDLTHFNKAILALSKLQTNKLRDLCCVLIPFTISQSNLDKQVCVGHF